jgi:hypothetical protein
MTDLKAGSSPLSALDWRYQGLVLIDLLKIYLCFRQVAVKPAIRNPDISKTRRTMSRGNCTTCRLYGQVGRFPMSMSELAIMRLLDFAPRLEFHIST